MIQVSQAIALAEQHVAKHRFSDRRRLGRRLLARRLELSESQLLTRFNQAVDEQTVAGLISDLQRFNIGEPLGYIEGTVEFLDWEFKIDGRALCPRQETEFLAATIPKRITNEPKHIIDLGCGSGVLGLSLAARYPQARVWLVDLSGDALDLSRENADLLGLSSRVNCLQSDWWQAVPDDLEFDLIVSNPPYVASNDEVEAGVTNFEPAVALLGGADGADPFRAILRQLNARLTQQGTAFFELGHHHHNTLVNELVQTPATWFDDPWGVRRFLSIRKEVPCLF